MKTKTKIVRAFLENNKPMTIKDISKNIKSDYKITHTAVHRLLSEKVLFSNKIGPATLCDLDKNYHGIETQLAENARTNEVLKDNNISKLRTDILNKLDKSLYILVLKKGLVREINLLFICNEDSFSQKVKEVINTIPLQVNYTCVTEKEFRELNQDHSKNIILHNLESYYLLKKNNNY